MNNNSFYGIWGTQKQSLQNINFVCSTLLKDKKRPLSSYTIHQEEKGPALGHLEQSTVKSTEYIYHHWPQMKAP